MINNRLYLTEVIENPTVIKILSPPLAIMALPTAAMAAAAAQIGSDRRAEGRWTGGLEMLSRGGRGVMSGNQRC